MYCIDNSLRAAKAWAILFWPNVQTNPHRPIYIWFIGSSKVPKVTFIHGWDWGGPKKGTVEFQEKTWGINGRFLSKIKGPICRQLDGVRFSVLHVFCCCVLVYQVMFWCGSIVPLQISSKRNLFVIFWKWAGSNHQLCQWDCPPHCQVSLTSNI